jgi:hypothetical protein
VDSGNSALQKRFLAAILVTLLDMMPIAASAEGFSWNGFVQSHVAARTRGVQCPAETECDFPSADLRGQLEAEGKNAAGNSGFLSRFDLLYGDLRSERLAARLGRQVITWGVGDLLFINDTFPRDRVALFTGQPQQYFKLGSDALKLNAYRGSATGELVIAGFRPDNIPTRRRFVLADPLPAGLPRRTEEPGNNPAELEISGRVSGYLDNWELAGYASRTHFHSPALRVKGAEIVGTYPRLNALGASVTGAVDKGVLSLEAGYYDSSQDRDGGDPSIENSQFRGLVGYARQPWEDATLGLQLYGEWMRQYGAYRETLPAGFPAKDRVRKVATLRFTQLFAHQTLTFNVFAFFGVNERDRYVVPSLRYAISDDLWIEIGANVFGGNRNGPFGSLQDNDNVYLTVRFAL